MSHGYEIFLHDKIMDKTEKHDNLRKGIGNTYD